MSSVLHTISSASSPSPRLRPDDSEQENNTHVQILVLETGPPADRLDIDLEMASTEVKPSFHEAVLTTGTAREHNHVSSNTDDLSKNRGWPRIVPVEAAFSGISTRLTPRQGQHSSTKKPIPAPLRSRVVSRRLRGVNGRLISLPIEDELLPSDVELKEGDYKKVEKHLEVLRQRNPITILDALFRHNLLFSRAKLYQLFLELRPVVHNLTSEIGAEPTESTSFRRIDDIRQALGDYSSAMDAYRTFRKEPGEIDRDDHMMFLAGMLTELDNKRSRLKAAQQSNSKTVDSEADISSFEAKIAHVLVNGAKFSPAGVRTEEESKARLGFLARLTMAIFGGAALVVPMLIMSLRPSKLTGLLTTSLFVVGVAVALAWFMKDAAPKDVLAATAAYAAVLVVFVGTDGA